MSKKKIKPSSGSYDVRGVKYVISEIISPPGAPLLDSVVALRMSEYEASAICDALNYAYSSGFTAGKDQCEDERRGRNDQARRRDA